MRREHRIVPADQVPADQQHLGLVENCFYCYCPRHPKKRKAVAAITVVGFDQYYGICGYHAEVYPTTEEEAQKRPMLCPHCFPR